jgi:hypothetical protein
MLFFTTPPTTLPHTVILRFAILLQFVGFVDKGTADHNRTTVITVHTVHTVHTINRINLLDAADC